MKSKNKDATSLPILKPLQRDKYFAFGVCYSLALMAQAKSTEAYIVFHDQVKELAQFHYPEFFQTYKQHVSNSPHVKNKNKRRNVEKD